MIRAASASMRFTCIVRRQLARSAAPSYGTTTLDAPSLLVSSARGRWVLAATVLGSGIATLDATVVNIALPTIGREFHASASQLQWVVNGYTLTLAALLLVGGTLGDRFGTAAGLPDRRGLVHRGLGRLRLAPDAGALIVCASLQGVGGALMTRGAWPSSRPRSGRRTAAGHRGLDGPGRCRRRRRTVARRLPRSPPRRGGDLLHQPARRAVILMLALRHVPESRDPDAPAHVDVAGALMAMAALAGLTYGLTEGPATGWDRRERGRAGGRRAVRRLFVVVERAPPRRCCRCRSSGPASSR